jgi:hypothetical protein
MATWKEYDGSRHAESTEAEIDEILTDNERFCGTNLWAEWDLNDKKQLADWILGIDMNGWLERHDSQGVTISDTEYLLEPPILEIEE